MRVLFLLLVAVFGVWSGSISALAGEYRLTNGDIIQGEPVTFNDDGMVVRLDIGGYSPRISWSKLTQDSLKELANNPKAAEFVQPFIDTPPVQKEKAKKKDIVLKPVPRIERVANPSLLASFATPAGLMVFLVLFLGNLYAARQIAVFRYRPPALVCGLSVIFPVLAPALFLVMPPGGVAETEAEGFAPAAGTAQAAGKTTTGPLAKVPMESGLSLAQAKKTATVAQGTQVFKRGEFTFNRRFMETKFPSFFRVVQSEKQVLVVRVPKDEYIAKRISRISANEMHLQLLRGDEISVQFAEILEIQVRPNGGA